MSLDDALALVIDAANQHREALKHATRLDGAVALLSEAIEIVEKHKEECQ
jgi:hypothetical protein